MNDDGDLMKSPRSYPFKNTLPLAALCGFALLSCAADANAQANLVSPAPASFKPPTNAQALTLLQLNRAEKVLQTPIDLTAQSATLEDVATQVQKTLIAARITPKMGIEVRKARPVRLSFKAKSATVGAVLKSSGQLAGVRLWVFGDHLLLAPPETLLLAEKESNDTVSVSQTMAFSAFIGNEIKGRRTENGANAAGAEQNKTTFGQLSPDAQEMLQILVANASIGLKLPASETVLSSNTPVGFSPQRSENINVSFSGTNQVGLSWSMTNPGSTAGISAVRKIFSSSTPVTVSAPFLDPSANKS